MIEADSKRLGMFAKYWQPHRVKTRLGREIGFELASQLYLKFLETLLVRLCSVGDERTLVITPASRLRDFQQLCDAKPWRLAAQSEGDLGVRMSDFFEHQLASVAGRVVLIGSDSPTIPIRVVEQAFADLENHDLVVGPSHDGGYYLLGMKSPLPALFSGIGWSTNRVLQQTLDRVSEAYPRLSVQLLEPWYDVDSLEDVRRLGAELQAATGLEPTMVELQDLCAAVLGN